MTCTCRTCCIAQAILRGDFVGKGWTREQTQLIAVTGGDFHGGCDPALGHVKVADREVFRFYTSPDEALAPTAVVDIEAAMRRELC